MENAVAQLVGENERTDGGIKVGVYYDYFPPRLVEKETLAGVGRNAHRFPQHCDILTLAELFRVYSAVLFREGMSAGADIFCCHWPSPP